MNRFFVIIFLIIGLIGCKPGIPDYVIPPEKMQDILFDMHVVDAHIGTITKVDSAKVVASKYYHGVYKKYNIDSAKYNLSLSYYYKNPIKYNEVLEQVKLKFDQVKKQNDEREQLDSQKSLNQQVLKNNTYLQVLPADSTRKISVFSVDPFTYLSNFEE